MPRWIRAAAPSSVAVRPRTAEGKVAHPRRTYNLEMKRFEIGDAILLTRSTSSIFASCICTTRASWCFLFVVFLIFFLAALSVVLGCTRTANRPNALRSSLVVLGSTPGSLFWCSCSCLVLRVSLFVLVLGSNPAQCASWCLDQPEINLRSGCDQPEINLRSGEAKVRST